MTVSPDSSPVFLVGFMGSGKSTVGRELAGKTGIAFLELDALIEKESNSSISELFERQGEERFRKIEASILRGLDLEGQRIIATGGGTPVFHENMEWMKSKGIVVHLQCRPGILFHRLAPEKTTRPLLTQLTDIELMGFIIDTLKSRLSIYSKAHLQVNAEKKPAEIATEITNKLNTAFTNS